MHSRRIRFGFPQNEHLAMSSPSARRLASSTHDRQMKTYGPSASESFAVPQKLHVMANLRLPYLCAPRTQREAWSLTLGPRSSGTIRYMDIVQPVPQFKPQ